LIKIWFLMAYIAFPDQTFIHYEGFGGYEHKEQCEGRVVWLQNYLDDRELVHGHVAYVNVICEEIWAFPESIELRKKQNPAEFGA